jgi:hypothetical protein
MATFFALDTLVRAREEKLYVSFMKILKNLYTQHVPVRASSTRGCTSMLSNPRWPWRVVSAQASRWLLVSLMDQHKKWYRYHMLDCQDQYVREGFAELLAALLKTVAVHEYDIMAKERCGSPHTHFTYTSVPGGTDAGSFPLGCGA